MNSSSKPNRPIVGVKIAPPSQTSHLITRTRLNSWMREAIKSPFTFIISPAGYGKTSTVLSWAASLQNTPLGWLTLEREENSLDRFWTYFGAAIQTMLPHASLPEATGSSFATAQSTLLYLDELICTVAAHPEHVILVLEDLHTISGEDVLESLSYFMLHIPSNIHFVVTSRRTPDFKGYCKLKAAGLLVEIGESDLRFSRAETRELFRKASQEISDSVLDEIVEITKGWPIAIKFIMLSPALQSDEPHTSDLRVETDLLCDYCTQEILSDLPLELKEFMLKSATINPFCRSLALSALEIDDQHFSESITTLLNANFFLTETIDTTQTTWYRYHDLFAEAMEKIARHELNDYTDSKRRASIWYKEHRMMEKAISIAAQIQAYDIIEQIIVENWRAYHVAELLPTLVRWLSFLPEQQIMENAELCVVKVLTAGICGDIATAERFWLITSSLIQNDTALYAEAAVIKLIVSIMAGQFEEGRRYASIVIELSDKLNFFLRGIGLLSIGTIYIRDDPMTARTLLEHAHNDLPQLGNTSLTCLTYTSIVSLESSLGYSKKAYFYLDKAYSLYPPIHGNHYPPMFITAFPACAAMAYRCGEIASAQSYITLFIENSEGNKVLPYEAMILTCAAQIEQHKDNVQEAFELIKYAATLSIEGVARGYPSLSNLQRWIDEGLLLNENPESAFNDALNLPSVQRLVWSIRFLQGDLSWKDELDATLSNLNPAQLIDRIELGILSALVEERLNNKTAANAALYTTLDLLSENEAFQIFLDDYTMLEPILKRLNSLETNKWLSKIIQLHKTQSPLTESAKQELPLTKRETAILQLVEEGAETQDIANTLGVSVQTVRKHLSNSFAKLGAHSRSQAIAKLKNYQNHQDSTHDPYTTIYAPYLVRHETFCATHTPPKELPTSF